MVILASELLGCRHFLRSLITPTFSCSESFELLSLGYLLVLFDIWFCCFLLNIELILFAIYSLIKAVVELL